MVTSSRNRSYFVWGDYDFKPIGILILLAGIFAFLLFYNPNTPGCHEIPTFSINVFTFNKIAAGPIAKIAGSRQPSSFAASVSTKPGYYENSDEVWTANKLINNATTKGGLQQEIIFVSDRISDFNLNETGVYVASNREVYISGLDFKDFSRMQVPTTSSIVSLAVLDDRFIIASRDGLIWVGNRDLKTAEILYRSTVQIDMLKKINNSSFCFSGWDEQCGRSVLAIANFIGSELNVKSGFLKNMGVEAIKVIESSGEVIILTHTSIYKINATETALELIMKIPGSGMMTQHFDVTQDKEYAAWGDGNALSVADLLRREVVTLIMKESTSCAEKITSVAFIDESTLLVGFFSGWIGSADVKSVYNSAVLHANSKVSEREFKLRNKGTE